MTDFTHVRMDDQGSKDHLYVGDHGKESVIGRQRKLVFIFTHTFSKSTWCHWFVYHFCLSIHM